MQDTTNNISNTELQMQNDGSNSKTALNKPLTKYQLLSQINGTLNTDKSNDEQLKIKIKELSDLLSNGEVKANHNGVIYIPQVPTVGMVLLNSSSLYMKNLGEKELITETIVRDIIVLIILIILMYWEHREKRYRGMNLNKKNLRKNTKFIVMTVLSGMLIGIIITGILTTFIHSNKFTTNIVDSFKLSKNGIVLMLLVAPVVEEFVFRGILFNYLRKNCSIITAIVIQALAFAIYHGNITQGIYAFILGIFLAMIYVYTNSLIGSIIGHILSNLIDLILVFKIVLLGFVILSVVCIIILIKNRKKYYNECYL